jgi:hypothetical protein
MTVVENTAEGVQCAWFQQFSDATWAAAPNFACFPGEALALSSSTTWEVRVTGSDVNGGGFVSTALEVMPAV